MPWLMKAEPDSRVEKGRDVKVGYIPLDHGHGHRADCSTVLGR
jgi:hypothetical protein